MSGNQASLKLIRRLGFRMEVAITSSMTDFAPVDPHPTRPAR
jgi:hypothetical protein